MYDVLHHTYDIVCLFWRQLQLTLNSQKTLSKACAYGHMVSYTLHHFLVLVNSADMWETWLFFTQKMDIVTRQFDCLATNKLCRWAQVFACFLQWPSGRCVGSSWHHAGHVTSCNLRPTGWANSAGARPATHRFKLFLSRADCSMDSICVEITHVWNTPGKGSFRRECVVIKSSSINQRFIITA